MYNVLFSDPAKKEFRQLDPETQTRVIEVLERIRFRPLHFVMRLSGSHAYRLRVGKYRIILDIDEANGSITILKIGNRENVYNS